MTATLTAPVEALLREQVAKGHFPSLDRALDVAVKAVDGRRASSPPFEASRQLRPMLVTSGHDDCLALH